MNRLSTVFVIAVIVAGLLCAFQMHTGRANGVPSGSCDPVEVLIALYAAVPPGGSISLATSALTEPRVAVELVRARQRGVNVRVIADRQRLAEKRDEISLYNLRHYGVPVRINTSPKPITLRASIINGVYVATGTYDYSVPGTPGSTLTVTASSENDLLRRYEEAFDAMWADETSFKTLEPMDVVRVVAFHGKHTDQRQRHD